MPKETDKRKGSADSLTPNVSPAEHKNGPKVYSCALGQQMSSCNFYEGINLVNASFLLPSTM